MSMSMDKMDWTDCLEVLIILGLAAYAINYIRKVNKQKDLQKTKNQTQTGKCLQKNMTFWTDVGFSECNLIPFPEDFFSWPGQRKTSLFSDLLKKTHTQGP